MKGWGIVNQIKVMLAEKRGVSEIARRLGIDRKTVRKYRELSMEEVAADRRRSEQRRKKLDAYGKWIEQRVELMVADGVVNAQAIYDELKTLGYVGSARSVRRWVTRLRQQSRKKRTYEPFETPPGHQAMVDLAESRGLRIGGRKQTVYWVAMILSHSRKQYVQWYDRPIDTEMFLQFHQNAFEALGGVPRQIVYDQTKLAVISERYGEVQFNESFYGFASWCRYEPYICRKFDPETKGKIEAAIRYVKRGFLPGRSFDDLTDLERQFRQWLQEVADVKVHETTGRPPGVAWQEERPHLQPWAGQGYQSVPAFRIQQVGRDGLVKVLGNRYSVPSSHQGEEVHVRVTEEKVEFRTLEGVALDTHWRCLDRGKTFKLKEHYPKTYSVPTEDLTRQVLAQTNSPEWVATLRQKFPRHYREQCRQLLALAKKVDPQVLRQAVRRLLEHNCVGYTNLKKTVTYLESCAQLQELSQQNHQLVRDLPEDLGVQARATAYYDQVWEVGS